MSESEMINFKKNDEIIKEIEENNKKRFNQLLNSSRNIELIYRKMLDNEIPKEAVDFSGKNILFLCTSLRDFKKFIDLGVDINQRDNNGQNIAFKEQHIPYIQKLINDDVLKVKDIYDASGNTPFFKASDSYFETFLEKGVNINHLNKKGESALFPSNSRKTDKLIKLGIDTSITSKKGMHPLFGANLNKTLTLLKYNTDINVINKETGNNALFYINELETLSYLVDYGIDLNLINFQGENALFNATSFEIFRQLIEEYKLDFNLINNKGETVLFRKHEEKARLLLDKGVDPYVKDKNGKTAITSIPNPETLKMYMSKNIKIRDYVIAKGVENIKNNFKINEELKFEILERYTYEEKEIILPPSENKIEDKQGGKKRL